MNKPVYLCDPEKNEWCPKDGCYILGGPCRHTTDKAYEKKQTNQDKIAEIVRTMSPEKLAGILSGDNWETDIFNCDDCPVRASYEDNSCPEGTCRDIISKWLKEDAKDD